MNTVKVNFHFDSSSDPDACNRMLNDNPDMVEILYHTVEACRWFLPDHKYSLHHLPGQVHILIKDKPESYLEEAKGNADRADRDNIWSKYEKENDKAWAAFMEWKTKAGLQFASYPSLKRVHVHKILSGPAVFENGKRLKV